MSYGIKMHGHTKQNTFKNVTIHTLTKIIFKKPSYYSIENIFNVFNLKVLFYKHVILYILKIDLLPFNIQHDYFIRLKTLNNLNHVKVNTQFGNINTVNMTIDEKLNLSNSKLKLFF